MPEDITGASIIRGCLGTSTPQSLHSFIRGLKPPFSANPSHGSLFSLFGLPIWFAVLVTTVSPAKTDEPIEMIRHDTIRDAKLTCAQKPTRVSVTYHTEPTTKIWKTKK